MKKIYLLSMFYSLFVCFFISCSSDHLNDSISNETELSFKEQIALNNFFISLKQMEDSIHKTIVSFDNGKETMKKTMDLSDSDFGLINNQTEALGQMGTEVFKVFGFTQNELNSMIGDKNKAILGLAVIETVAEAQLMDLGIFGGTNNGYQVVSKAFISQAGQCLMDVLGLDAGIALFNAIEGKVLDQQAFREALKKVVGKILDRTSKLVASGAVGAAIIITQWSYCMYKNRQAY